MELPEIVIYSKPACCLCERVKQQLKRLHQQHEFTLREVNILDDLAAHEAFKNEIPVIFIDGKKAFKYRLEEKKFIRLLKSCDHKQQEGRISTP